MYLPSTIKHHVQAAAIAQTFSHVTGFQVKRVHAEQEAY